ncbi:hypothetical protein [Thalassobacillus hwangdonensis]|uniref:Transposase n=1 Tax=Thalassobacillus hwangdonensis TaxID=546108 RepID=A0ABW3L8U3_9BACI
MLTYEVKDSDLHKVKPMDEEIICEEIEELAGRHGLKLTQRTTLSTKKGSYHWHFKKGKEKGVLEITYWPKRHQLWLDIHDNRRAEWNLEIIERLAEDLSEHFCGKVEVNQ